MQDQLLTNEIQELNRKVSPEMEKLRTYSLFKTYFYILQGDIIQQENEELYKKVNLICQENMELKKVLVWMAIETKNNLKLNYPL